MTSKNKLKGLTHSSDIEQYYLDIINGVSDIVYWIDNESHLVGCNQQYIHWLGMKKIRDVHTSPYEQMSQYTTWSQDRIKEFKLEDMRVLFSGTGHTYRDEAPLYDEQGIAHYYRANRTPLLDKEHNVIGLVVVLTDITELKAKNAELSASSQPKQSPMYYASPNVLMVEDNYLAQKVEEAILTECHCRVDIADTGDKAVHLFDPGKYDIVFMDIGLEDTSGYVVAKKMRQMEQNTAYHVPIIALTSYQADVVKYDCSDYFMEGVITKPITRKQVEQIIQHYIYHQNVVVEGLTNVDVHVMKR